MLDKKDIINFLFLISFPLYGAGSWVYSNINSMAGYATSVFIHVIIVLFYLIDLLYKKEFTVKVNGLFYLMIAFQISCIACFFVALEKNPPFLNELYSYTRSGILLFPFYAFVAVYLYNERQPDKLVKLTFDSLSLLLFVNLIGFYGLGLKNGTHNIEGRLSMPFIDGMYSGACMIAILNLMILYYLKKTVNDPFRFTYLILYFLLNLFLLFLINSRLANLIFLLVFGLYLINMIHRTKGLFLVGVLFVPLLLNLGFLLYQILSLPIFKVVMQRVDLKDVTTFNGRAFPWQRVMDWLATDQTGIIYGNGHNGHYFLHLMPDIAKLWGVKETSTHLHSTALSIIVDQGIIGYGIFISISFYTYIFYKKKLEKGGKEGMFFPVMVFILIVMQVDMFVYRECLGAVLLSFLAAGASLNLKKSGKELSNS
jgi:hypothetical protein